ncbi:MAG: PepSY-like domain-containing protein [Sphingobacterium sp.]
MKKLKNLSVAMLMVTVLASCDKDDNEEIIKTEDLPATGQSFLKEHFGDQKIISVEKENEGSEGIEYEARLDNGVVVKFDKDGVWKEADAPANLYLPTAFILPTIVNYVGTEYPDAGINDIDKERAGFDVELTSGLDLVFNLDGDFVRIDP